MGELCLLIWYGICFVGIMVFYDFWRVIVVGGLDLILFYNSKMRIIILFYFIVIIFFFGCFVGVYVIWLLCVLDICSGLYVLVCCVMYFFGYCIIIILFVVYMGVWFLWLLVFLSFVVFLMCIIMIKMV